MQWNVINSKIHYVLCRPCSLSYTATEMSKWKSRRLTTCNKDRYVCGNAEKKYANISGRRQDIQQQRAFVKGEILYLKHNNFTLRTPQALKSGSQLKDHAKFGFQPTTYI